MFAQSTQRDGPAASSTRSTSPSKLAVALGWSFVPEAHEDHVGQVRPGGDLRHPVVGVTALRRGRLDLPFGKQSRQRRLGPLREGVPDHEQVPRGGRGAGPRRGLALRVHLRRWPGRFRRGGERPVDREQDEEEGFHGTNLVNLPPTALDYAAQRAA